MNLSIRKELEDDVPKVQEIISKAFESLEESNQTEHLLVADLRHSECFIPELSLVALLGGKAVGHILLTRAHIKNTHSKFEVLALAPVTVLPDYQGMGIGSNLIKEAHNRARSQGYNAVVLLGHKDYYPRFGYQSASSYSISFPFDVPDEYTMALELQPAALDGIEGMVHYHPVFYKDYAKDNG